MPIIKSWTSVLEQLMHFPAYILMGKGGGDLPSQVELSQFYFSLRELPVSCMQLKMIEAAVGMQSQEFNT